MEHIANQLTVRGTLASPPEFSHENHGRSFYRFSLEVPRLSSAIDVLPVIAGAELMECLCPEEKGMITVTGQLRSHNIRIDGKRRLLIFIFATSICFEDGEPRNEISLEGILCRDPVFRRTPLGREICDVMLAVPRAPRRTDHIPCILWGQTARHISSCKTGDRVSIFGRLQSRDYTKLTDTGPVQKTAYEVSALMGEVLTDRTTSCDPACSVIE